MQTATYFLETVLRVESHSHLFRTYSSKGPFVFRAFIAVLLLMGAPALAQLEELENPGTVSAVQQRLYRMQHEINLAFGVLPLDAFYKGIYGQVGYTAHFTDHFAWQIGRFAYAAPIKTGLREQLERDFGVLPTVFEEVQFFFGSDIMWKPFYGKFSVMNTWVWQVEAFLIAGVSVFKFTNTIQPGINLGGGFRLFLNRYVSLRVDVTNNIVFPIGGGSVTVNNVMQVNAGLSFNFFTSE